MAYSPPNSLAFDFAAAYSGTLSFEFNPVNTTQTVGAVGTDVSAVAAPTTSNAAPNVTPVSVSFSVVGEPFVNFRGADITTVPVGIAAPPVDAPSLRSGVVRADFTLQLPAPTAGDWLFFEFDAPGVTRLVYPHGLDSARFGPAIVRINSDIDTEGFDSLVFGATTVDTRIHYAAPAGISETVVGTRATVGRALRFKFDNPIYTPPAPVDFDFVLQGGTQGAYVALGDLLQFGATSARNDRELVAPTGIPPAGFGSALLDIIYNDPQDVYCAGVVGFASGTATVINRNRDVFPAGFNSLEFGGNRAQLGKRFITATGGDDVSDYGTARVELFNRRMDADTVGDTSDFGTQIAWFRVRSVAPQGAFFTPSYTQLGTANVRDARQVVTPAGVAPSPFGVPTTFRDELPAAPPGIAPGGFPPPDVQLLRQFITVRDTPEQSGYGVGDVFNSRQYLQQIFDGEAFYLVGAVGEPYAENRNRTVRTYGVDTAKVSVGAEAFNNARVVSPDGLDTLFGVSFISFGVRSIATIGFEDSFLPHYNAVHNGSRILEPSGIPRPLAGVPTVWDNTQRIDCNGTRTEFTEFGYPMVAPRVRGISLDENHFGIRTPYFPDHDAQLYSRYVQTPSIEGGSGVPTVEHFRNLVNLHGRDFSRLGEPAVRNRTPNLYIGPWIDSEFGRATVGTDQYVDLTGLGAGGFGGEFARPHVEYRTRSMTPASWLSMRIPALHEVRRDEPEIPARQNVFVETIDPSRYGVPDLDRRGAIVPSFGAALFGAARVTLVSVRGARILLDEELQFGLPVLTYRQVMFHRSQFASSVVGIPRMNPTTIWISEPPRPPYTREINSVVDEVYGSAYPTFGRVQVESTLRTIFPYHLPPIFDDTVGERMGVPEAQLKNRTLILDGIPARRVGVPNLPSGQTITPYWGRDTEDFIPGGGYDTAGYGLAEVRYPYPPPDPRVRPVGFNSLRMGGPEVQLFNREVRPFGLYATIFTGFNWVHPPIRLRPQGINQSTAGLAWASHRIRNVYPSGFMSSKFAGTFFGTDSFKVLQEHFISPAGMRADGVPTPSARLLRINGVVASVGSTGSFGRPRVGECVC